MSAGVSVSVWPPEAIAEERNRVIQEALTWIGTPYLHRGRIKGVGVDCAMLIASVFEARGLIPRVEVAYTRDWYLHRDEEVFLGYVERFAVRLPSVDLALPGDIALYRFGRCVAHGGLLLDGGSVPSWRIIHAHVDVGQVTIEHGLAPWLARTRARGSRPAVERFRGIYRLKQWMGARA